jgi:hypothetical protein
LIKNLEDDFIATVKQIKSKDRTAAIGVIPRIDSVDDLVALIELGVRKEDVLAHCS